MLSTARGNSPLMLHGGQSDTTLCLPRGGVYLKWLLDSGATFDLIGDKDLAPWQKDMVEESKETVRLIAANGELPGIDSQVPIQIKGLGDKAPLILPGRMAVLSLGRLVMKEGYSFRWDGRKRGNGAIEFREPYLVSPDGKTKIRLKVHNYCPYFCEQGSEGAAFSSKGEPSAGGAVSANAEGLGPAVEVPNAGLGQRNLKLEAGSLSHLMTHTPKNPHCPACQQAKIRAKATPDRQGHAGGSSLPKTRVRRPDHC